MLESYFELSRHGTTARREALAGVTTFLTMAYILVVHPGILEEAGMNRRASITVTAIVAAGATVLMGLYARRPFAIAPYMGENAFIAFIVVKGLGHSWQQALGAVFIGGVLFTLITVLGLRAWLGRAIPPSLKYSFVAGIGLFLTLVGLYFSGIVTKPAANVPLELADITEPRVALAMGALFLMLILHTLEVRSGILVSICATTGVAWLLGEYRLPDKVFSMPDARPVFLKLDITNALTPGFFPVILTVFVLDFVDTLGTLVGVSARAGLLDESGNLPQIEKPMLVDSLATAGGALLGTTTSGVFIESAAGIEAGGRTGLTAVVTGLCFLPALFLGDLLGSIPGFAYGPALVLVGLFMFEPIRRVDFSDNTEVVPTFATIAFMVFAFNIGQGITLGLILYPLLKVLRGRAREVPAGLWVLATLSLSYYVFMAVLFALRA